MPVDVMSDRFLFAVQLQDECLGLLPMAKSCGRIEVPDIAQIEQFGAPAFCHSSNGRKTGKVIIGTAGHQAWERQRTLG